MTLLDAYGLVALVADEAAASEVEGLLRAGECRVVTVNLAETVDICRRSHDFTASEIRNALEPLIVSGTLEVAVSGASDAWLAADLRARYYHRSKLPLSMADCFLLAHAVSSDDSLATSDPCVAEVARSEGATLIALPDRAGKRP